MTLPETELLQYVHKTADMGCQGLKSVLDYADGSLRSALESQLKEYQNLRTQAAGLLRARQERPGSAGALARASAEAMTFGKLMLDSSPSRIAEMTIQGCAVGAAKTLRHLRDYAGQDAQVLDLTRRLLAAEEAGAEEMKSFL